MPGHWDFNESTGQAYWVEDPEPTPYVPVQPTGPDVWNYYQEFGNPAGSTEPYLPLVTRNDNGADNSWRNELAGNDPTLYDRGNGRRQWSGFDNNLDSWSPSWGEAPNGWDTGAYGYGEMLRRLNYNAYGLGAGGVGPGVQRSQTPSGATANPASSGNRGGGGGGGDTPVPVDPYAWMADFGGAAIFKAFLRNAGEKLQDYYTRLGGDPLKTLVNKYQELKGYSPSQTLKSMMISALGWEGGIDPVTLQPIANMPTNPMLENLAKTGGNYSGYNKNLGVRVVGTRPWYEVTKGWQEYSPVAAASWPPAS